MTRIVSETTHEKLGITLERGHDGTGIRIEIRATEGPRELTDCHSPEAFRQLGELHAMSFELMTEITKRANKVLTPDHIGYAVSHQGIISMPNLINRSIKDDDLKAAFDTAVTDAIRHLRTRPPSSPAKRSA